MKSFNEIFSILYDSWYSSNFNVAKANRSCYSNNDICNSLITMVTKNTFWSKSKFETDDKLSTINGKNLNKIHNKLCSKGFYDYFYKKLLEEYVGVTDGKTLNLQAIDGCFVQNVYGEYLYKHNPAFYNKTGMKNTALVDKEGVLLSLIITESTESDQYLVEKTVDNYFIDFEKILNRKLETVTLLMDGGYDSLVNLLLLSDKGYNVISGTKANKNFKISEDEQINEEIIKLYKCRGIVENYFARMKQYRILRNQFEKTMESYTGLYMFSNCLSLYKKLVHLEKII